MKVHLAHVRYLLNRKWTFFRMGGLVGVSFGERLTHDLYQFRPSFWSVAVQVFHRGDPEEWIKARMKEIRPTFAVPSTGISEEDIDDAALEQAKDDHAALSKELAKVSDLYSLLVQHTARHRWEFYIVRDMGQTRKVEMPERYVRAMVADWLTGALMDGVPRDELYVRVRRWYAMYRQDIQLTPNNRKLVETLLTGLK